MKQYILTITLFSILTILPFNLFGQDSMQNATPTPIVTKTGTLNDCKIILSEGCRSYLLQAKASDILPQFKDAFIFEGKELVSNAFRAKIVEATGGILSVEFTGDTKNPFGQPAENVKWGESVGKFKQKYGEPLKISLDSNRATHSYKNFELVYFANKLRGINFSRTITESEIAAKKVAEENRNSRNAEAERIAKIPEAERIANTPGWKLKEYFIANNELGEKMDKYTLDINKMVSRYNEWIVKYGKTVEVKKIGYDVTHLCYEAIRLIDTFLLKYPDQISSKRKSELLQARKDYSSLMNPK